jgi:hypothetical protein
VRVFPDCFAADDTVVPWADVSRVLAYANEDGLRPSARRATCRPRLNAWSLC